MGHVRRALLPFPRLTRRGDLGDHGGDRGIRTVSGPPARGPRGVRATGKRAQGESSEGCRTDPPPAGGHGDGSAPADGRGQGSGESGEPDPRRVIGASHVAHAPHVTHATRTASRRIAPAVRRPPPGSPLGHTGDRGVHPSADGRSGMKVTRALAPLLPLCERFLPTRPAGLSMTLLKATALELAILAGHLLLYPSGMTQERRVTPTLPHPTRPDCRPRRGPRSSCCTASSTTARSSSCCAAPSRSTAAGTSSRSTTHLSPGTSAPPPSCSAGTSRTSASARARSRWTSSGTASAD